MYALNPACVNGTELKKKRNGTELKKKIFNLISRRKQEIICICISVVERICWNSVGCWGEAGGWVEQCVGPAGVLGCPPPSRASTLVWFAVSFY